MTDTPPPATSPTEDRTVAILSYLTIIGFIVALILHSSKKTTLGAYHLRQCLGLIITSLVLAPVSMALGIIPIIGWIAAPILWLAFLIFWLIGLVAAAQGQQKPVPLLGEKYQQWFSGAFV